MTCFLQSTLPRCDRCSVTFACSKRAVLEAPRRVHPHETITEVKIMSAPITPEPSRAPPCAAPSRSPPTPAAAAAQLPATGEESAGPGLSRRQGHSLCSVVGFFPAVSGCACAGPSRRHRAPASPARGGDLRCAVPSHRGRAACSSPRWDSGHGAPRSLLATCVSSVKPEPEGRGEHSRGSPCPPLLSSSLSGSGSSPGTCVFSCVTGLVFVLQPH